MKEIINRKQAVSVLVMFLMGTNTVLGAGSNSRDTWLSILLGALFFAPVALVYMRITNLYPGKNLYDIILIVFGKITGKIMVAIFTLYAIHVGALVLREFTEFMHIAAMSGTPQVVFLILMLSLSAWMVKSGVEILGRFSKFILPIILAEIAITFIIALKDMDFSNLMPVGHSGFGSIASEAYSLFILPFSEAVIFLTLYRSVKTDQKRNSILVYGTGIAVVLMMIVIIRNIAVLGPENLKLLYFPTYTTVSVLSLGDFFTRMEILVAAVYLLCGLVKASVFLFAVSFGMSKLFNVENYKSMAFPAGLIMLTLASIIYSSISESVEFLEIFRYYATPFQVILPVIIWLGAEIKNFLNKINPKTPLDLSDL